MNDFSFITWFLFQKERAYIDLVLGGVVIGLIYIAMCFNGGTTGFGFEIYPYDLFNNSAHYSGAIAGLIFALTVKGARVGCGRKE